MDSRTLFMGLNLFMFLFFMVCTANSSTNNFKISEENYLNWVKGMSWRNQSQSNLVEAKNKNSLFHEPCKKIKVHKNPKLGDFTTVKKAIASLPLFNPCRVVISVAPGTYR